MKRTSYSEILSGVRDCKLRTVLVACVGTFGTAVSGAVFAEPFFTDGFESGNLDSPQKDFQWVGGVRTEVSTENPRSGDYSLRFSYPGGSMDDDAYAEQRFTMGRELTEVWIQWHLYIPSNYRHRDPSGTSNNKFFFLWSREYGSSAEWGNTLSFEMWADGDSGQSRLTYNPIDHSGHKGHRPTVIDPAKDAGKWVEFTLHYRLQSSASSSDGVLEFWKHTEGASRQKLFDLHNMDSTWGPSWTEWPEYNFLDKGYFLGWANAGFDEDTILYIDDVAFSEEPLLDDFRVPAAPQSLTAD